MRNWTGADAVAHILGAADAAAAFAEASGDKRRTARLYRVLAFAVHPDRAALEGIDPADADSATKRLNELYDQVKDGGAKPAPKPAAAPHVIGKNGTYLLRDRLSVMYNAPNVATYLTDQRGIRVDIAREESANADVQALVKVAGPLAAADMAAFAPELVDEGVVAGRAWVAYRLPDGLYSLREILAAYPNRLDGRDWAWMARRIYMVLAAAGRPHGRLSIDSVLIHPEQHGVVIAGWSDATKSRRYRADVPQYVDGFAIGSLFVSMLADEPRQDMFARRSAELAPEQALREYDLLLRALYGERRFRPFAVPA